MLVDLWSGGPIGGVRTKKEDSTMAVPRGLGLDHDGGADEERDDEVALQHSTTTTPQKKKGKMDCD